MLAFENIGLWFADIDFETNTTLWMTASRLTSLSKQVNRQFSQLSEQKQTREATRLGSVLFDVAFRQSDRSIQRGIFHITVAFSEKTLVDEHWYWDSREKRF